jgi:hypothetical protein
MDKYEQELHFDNFTRKMKNTLISKGNDYAGNKDRLANFNRAGAITGTSPEINCLSLIATKVARLGVLLNSEARPENEAVRDSVLDLANYSVLLDAILLDKQVQNTADLKGAL